MNFRGPVKGVYELDKVFQLCKGPSPEDERVVHVSV